MIKLTMSQCLNREYCKGYNNAVEKANKEIAELKDKLKPDEPLYTDCDEFQCPYCCEVIDETDSPIKCFACGQVLDWRGI